MVAGGGGGERVEAQAAQANRAGQGGGEDRSAAMGGKQRQARGYSPQATQGNKAIYEQAQR